MRSSAPPRLRVSSSFLRPALSLFAAVLAALVVLTSARDARAAGSFKFKNTEVKEVSGAWHLFVTIKLPKAPLTAHQSMKFVFTKTAVYERALVDNHKEPVTNRTVLDDQSPTIESLDVDFADPSGKIFKGTRFDFGLTRTRGYEAGEYKVELKTSGGTKIGRPVRLVLKGDNPVVDRRSMNFGAKESGIKKVKDDYDAGPKVAKNDTPAAMPMTGEVEATGEAKPFIPPEAYEETPEEQMKTRPKGCGCSLPGGVDTSAFAWGLPLVGLGLVALRSRSRRRARPRA